jgi:hypothetical protein
MGNKNAVQKLVEEMSVVDTDYNFYESNHIGFRRELDVYVQFDGIIYRLCYAWKWTGPDSRGALDGFPPEIDTDHNFYSGKAFDALVEAVIAKYPDLGGENKYKAVIRAVDEVTQDVVEGFRRDSARKERQAERLERVKEKIGVVDTTYIPRPDGPVGFRWDLELLVEFYGDTYALSYAWPDDQKNAEWVFSWDSLRPWDSPRPWLVTEGLRGKWYAALVESIYDAYPALILEDACEEDEKAIWNAINEAVESDVRRFLDFVAREERKAMEAKQARTIR